MLPSNPQIPSKFHQISQKVIYSKKIQPGILYCIICHVSLALSVWNDSSVLHWLQRPWHLKIINQMFCFVLRNPLICFVWYSHIIRFRLHIFPYIFLYSIGKEINWHPIFRAFGNIFQNSKRTHLLLQEFTSEILSTNFLNHAHKHKHRNAYCRIIFLEQKPGNNQMSIKNN